MDITLSAVTSELVSRFISFLISKYRNQAYLKKKKNLETLEHLLLRVHTVVEEADGRHIVNSRMLMQLKTLIEAMYQGYDVLDTHRPLEHIKAEKEVSGSSTVYFPVVRRFLMASSTAGSSKELQRALENLEATVANMTEFVVLLTGCERMARSPYSSYLCIDNFMFGRQVERQQIINILMLQDSPTVLPILGGCRVGKKTLVRSVCSDDRIRSHYSSILHFNGDEIQKTDRVFMPVRTLITVEFLSDVDDKEWFKFHSLVASLTGRGSKLIIVSRLEKLARFGTVKPVRINGFSREEYSYLFKVLAFGSADPADHPRLALIGKELAAMLQGSLVALNVYAAVLRNNLDVEFWVRVLKLYKKMTENNQSLFGEHPKTLLEKDGSAVDITEFSSSSCSAGATSLRLTLLSSGEREGSTQGELPVMTFGDIIAGSIVMPEKFQLVWESRLPPYTVISATCAAEKPRREGLRRKKRRRLSMSL